MSKKKLVIILIVATVIAYLSSLGNPFIWDDEQFITSNQYVQNFDIAKILTTSTTAGAGVQSNYYRPLTTLSFAIDSKLWGSNVFGFHLTNLLFHIGAGLMLFLLLLELFSFVKPAKGGAVLYPPFFIALFFLVNPLQTEAVTYINSRGDSMYAFFFFASLWLFAKRRVGLAVVVLFLASLLSKETALAGLGLYILIFLFFYTSYQLLHTKYFFWVIGIIGIVIAAYLSLRLTVLNFGNTLNFYGIQNDYTRYLPIRLYTFCKVLWIYLGLLVWPNPLHMERTVSLVKSFFSWEVLGAIGGIVAMGLLGIWQLKKNSRLPSGALAKDGWILFGLLWFLIMLVPASGIIPINGILYEHWLYVPMVGIALSAYGLGEMMISFFGKKILYALRPLLFALLIALAIIYVLLTVRQNNLWADPIQFYRYTLQFAPWSARLHNNLGETLANSGEAKDAIPEYQKALQLGPGYPQIYNNLGNAQITTGDYTNAEKNLKKALQLSPEFSVAKLNLIKLYVVEKEWSKAESLAAGNVGEIRAIREIEIQEGK